MGIDPISMLSFCVGALFAFAGSTLTNNRELRRQQEIVKRGEQALGTVTAMRRAPLSPGSPRSRRAHRFPAIRRYGGEGALPARESQTRRHLQARLAPALRM